jgi:archaellum component FlaC|tara:strand:+ start:143 stop:331 length:189 start_codon:yes stop_codon:yes gene_type:complete
VKAIQDVGKTIGEIDEIVKSISSTVEKHVTATEILNVSSELSEQSETLKTEVDKSMQQVRAA